MGRPSKRRTLTTALGLLWLGLAGASGAAAQAAEAEAPEPAFCHRHVLHDYLAPLRGLPPLREPPFRRTGRFIRFHGATIAASGPALAVSGGRAGFQIDWDRNPRWQLTLSLDRVDWSGRVMWGIGWRRLRLGDLGQALTTEPNFALPEKAGLYRTTLVVRSASGRKLGQFGNYYRVVRHSVHVGLALSAPAYAPGETLYGRVENAGAAFTLFGEEFDIEKQEGENWVLAPESPPPFVMPLYFVAPGMTSAHCTPFPLPASMPLGRYRLSQEMVISWPTFKGQLRPTLHAEFDVAAFAPPGAQ